MLQAHARHIAVFGVMAKRSALLQEKTNQLVDKLTSGSPGKAQQCCVWQSGQTIYREGSEQLIEFEKLAHKVAELGEEVIHKHLYKWEESPALHASEARRITFNERWSYQSVLRGHSPSVNSSSAVRWIKEPKDDTLLPCLSIEWTLAEGTRLSSKTGYYIDITTEPLLVILNRHYPHWRSAGVQHIQLVPPNVTLTRAVVDHPISGSSLDRCRSILRQVKQSGDQLKQSRRGFHNHQSMAQAIMSHAFDFILEEVKETSHPALHSAINELALLSKDIIQSSDICQYGSTPHRPSPDSIARLIYTSFSNLNETLAPEEKRLYAFAMSTTMIGTTDTSTLPDKVIDCFLITSRLALAGTLPLCGKTVQRQERLSEGKAEGKEQSHAAHQSDAMMPYGKDALTATGTSSVVTSKRRFDNTLPQEWTKHARMDGSIGASATSQKGKEPTLDRTIFKNALQHIMGKEMPDSKKEHHAQCVRLFKASVKEELVSAEQISREAMKICQQVTQDGGVLTLESHALELSKAVYAISRLAQEWSEDQDLDWIILTLAHHSMEIVNELVKEAEAAFRASLTPSSPFSSLRDALQIGIGKSKLSLPLINFLDNIRHLLETDVFCDPVTKAVDYVKQIEIDRALVEATRRVGQTEPLCKSNGQQLASTMKKDRRVSSSSGINAGGGHSWAEESEPVVYLTFINLGVINGTSADKAAARFRESVYDVLFQTYFAPLVQLFTSKNLKGGTNGMIQNLLWTTQRRFLKFRLQLIEKLICNCKIGSSVFAARSCSELVFAPDRYLPLTKEGVGVHPKIPYTFPLLTIKQGRSNIDATDMANWHGWEALYSSVRAAKDEILCLAKKRDPDQHLVRT